MPGKGIHLLSLLVLYGAFKTLQYYFTLGDLPLEEINNRQKDEDPQITYLCSQTLFYLKQEWSYPMLLCHGIT